MPKRSATATALVVGPPKDGAHSAEERPAGNVPDWEPRPAKDFDRGMLATFIEYEPEHPNGVVIINREHPVLVKQVQTFQDQYPDHLAEEVAKVVMQVYGEIAVSKVAHSADMKKLTADLDSLRTPSAMTMSLLGLMAEESLIQTRLGGRFGKARQQ